MILVIEVEVMRFIAPLRIILWHCTRRRVWSGFMAFMLLQGILYINSILETILIVEYEYIVSL